MFSTHPSGGEKDAVFNRGAIYVYGENVTMWFGINC